jgi:hypothetical protein
MLGWCHSLVVVTQVSMTPATAGSWRFSPYFGFSWHELAKMQENPRKHGTFQGFRGDVLKFPGKASHGSPAGQSGRG